MRFRRMFTKTASPVVADFGASSVKLLQITGGETPAIVAAQSVEIPDEARGNTDRRFAFLAEELPSVLRQGGFQGRRIICSPASSHFIVQQTRIDPTSTLSADDQVRSEVASRMSCLPAAVVTRSFPIPGSERDRVTLAIARDDVMRHVDLMKRCRFDLVGVQPDQFPMLRAFDHLHRRAEDRTVITMYVDAGWGAIKVAVARGTDLVFARIIPIGGRQFDEIAAAAWGCTASAARIRRVAEEREAVAAPAPVAREESAPEQMSAILRAGLAKAARDESQARERAAVGTVVANDRRQGGPSPSMSSVGSSATVAAELADVHESIAEELLMCARYSQAAIGSPIDRLVMVGGESHSRRFAGHLARRMGVKSSVGDPIRRLLAATPEGAGVLVPSEEHPEWTVACGLCAIEVEA
jgi:Tfp pilus assembly PilM family ATPase